MSNGTDFRQIPVSLGILSYHQCVISLTVAYDSYLFNANTTNCFMFEKI